MNSATLIPEGPSAVGGDGTRRVLAVMRWPVGGIRTHVGYNYPAAVEAGYRFTFVGPDDETFSTFAAGAPEMPGSEFVGARVNGSSCRLAPVVRRLLRSGRFDLMHSHGLTAGFHAALANIGVGTPHVATVHDPLRRDQFPGVRGRLKRWAMGRVLRGLDAAVCVSQDIRANLVEALPALAGRRLEMIANGIDLTRFEDETAGGDALRRRLGLVPDVALFGFLGRFMEQKGFVPLLRATAALLRRKPARPFHLVAVGSGDFEREYRAEATRLGLDGHVTFLDFVFDVRPVLQELDLLVVPSLWEASSLLSMEAMALGTPVLGTDCIGLREVLRDTPARSVAAGDVEALAGGMAAALADPWDAEARAFAGEARERFDNRRSARRLLELFDELTRTRRPL
jgi:glycosyltransferase involved in cell wall biosynthesis